MAEEKWDFFIVSSLGIFAEINDKCISYSLPPFDPIVIKLCKGEIENISRKEMVEIVRGSFRRAIALKKDVESLIKGELESRRKNV